MFETPEDRRARLNEEEREAHRRWRRRRRPSGGETLGGLVAGLLVAGIVAGLYSAGRKVQLGAERSELADTLGAIVSTQLGFQEANGRYLSLGSPSDAYDALAAGRPYLPVEGRDLRPDGLRGVYWVVGGDDTFEAHGMLDADGDGMPAHWVATEAAPPHAITDEEVY